MEIFITVRDDVIEDIRFRTLGCGSAIATSSMVTDMAKGKTLDEAMRITRDDVATELEGLPPKKMHCSNLAADALHAAIEDYREKQKKG
jgi:nitrogen fixation NifU-like protein